MNTAGATRLALAYVGTGALTAGILWEYERILESVSARSTLDLLHFSLHPVDATRLGVAFGLLLPGALRAASPALVVAPFVLLGGMLLDVGGSLAAVLRCIRHNRKLG